MSDTKFNSTQLHEKRKSIKIGIDNPEEYAALVEQYEKCMSELFTNATEIQKPLDIWLPYCEHPNRKFEEYIQKEGYVCKFTIQTSGSLLHDNIENRKGYLVAENDADLKKNERPVTGH